MTRAPAVEHVEADRWRSAVSAAIAGGAEFDCLYAAQTEQDPVVRLALRHGAQRAVLTARAAGSHLATVVDLLPAAEWDEREAHDIHGVVFDGHEPLRALVAHPADRDAWITSVEGPDVHEVAVGPIHAGVIESGHFRFHVVGERVLHLDLRLFYKHRGLERAAEGLTLAGGLPVAQRACAACAAANAVAYVQAAESLLGLQPDEDLRRNRTFVLELERLYNHLHDLSALCAGVGFDPGAMTFAALKERAQRVNERATGHRFLFGSVSLGSGVGGISIATAAQLSDEVEAIGSEAAAAWRTLTFMDAIQDRLRDVGQLAMRDAEHWGAVGPAARASGIHRDVRTDSDGGLWYPGLEPARPEQPTGDVAARAEVRAAELEQTCAMLTALLAAPPGPGRVTAVHEPAALGAGRVESPRGASFCCVEARDGRITRLHLRTASYANWPVLARVVPGAILPDFPLINKSFELCYACADR
ncbi:MAG TPA: NADH-quinone oxidoreductase subunit C [Solirubrobacteraceae bacterium]|nr:NADH-quinone oxidoreductase subunit C [Solirubrobacteraceae bacterium]